MRSLVGENVSQEDAMAGTGRPRDAESKRRRVEFLRLIAEEGVSCEEAAARARITEKRALAILTPFVRPILSRAA